MESARSPSSARSSWRPGWRVVTHLLPLSFLSVLALEVSLLAEPMMKPLPPPQSVDACRASHVIEAEYRSYRAESFFRGISYFQPPVAKYRVLRLYHGEPLPGETLEVRYDFQDGSACLAPENWKFDVSRMPATGSRWILFLELSNDGVYRTYRGDFGRVPAGTPEAERFLSGCAPAWGKDAGALQRSESE